LAATLKKWQHMATQSLLAHCCCCCIFGLLKSMLFIIIESIIWQVHRHTHTGKE